MGKVYAATALNFFFPGAGYLLLGDRMPLAVAWLIGVLGLTWVELQLSGSQYAVMFGSVLLMNTAFAIDAYQVGKKGLTI